jgi:hypothetical protein
VANKYHRPIRLNSILLQSFAGQVQQKILCVFQYGVLARLIEETHNIGILFISHINRRLYALLRSWHRLEELMNQSMPDEDASLHPCLFSAS